jgi:hypothetical protein
MRDRRFVAVHRGGPLRMEHHRQLAAWAADCASHVVPFLTGRTPDERPYLAVKAARAWSRGELSVGDARAASLGAHAASRAASGEAAIAAARSAGHAAATAHMADHALEAAAYALKAAAATGIAAADERAWQDAHLPMDVRELVLSARAKSDS